MELATWGGSLPEELVMEILRRLPVKTLLRFKCASKSWHSLITSTEFVKLHLRGSLDQHSSVVLVRFHCSDGVSFLGSFDFDHPQRPVVLLDNPDIIKYPERFIADRVYLPKIIGICNGVVCIQKADEYVLYNPATRAYKQVPRPNTTPGQLFNDGFGYDCIADDFKIFSVRHRSTKTSLCISETYLYTLKDNTWLKIGNPPFHVPRFCILVANNSLYWITRVDKMIIRFDLSSHLYEEISLPTEVISTKASLRLGVLKGRLHIMRLRSTWTVKEDYCPVCIWMLKEDNCWCQLFRCSEMEYKANHLWYSDLFERSVGTLCCTYSKDTRKIMLGIVQNPNASRLKAPVWFELLFCHLESQTTSMVQVVGLPEDATFTAAPWVESLVSLA